MSRFVSAGSSGEPTEADEAWAKAQERIDATRQQKDKPKVGEQEGGKSLYEHLQANKAAKQEAFEEATRLRNQFRTLDEDEIDFLDSVLESTRSKEAELKKETREQLAVFRQQQEEAEKAAKGIEGTADAPAEDIPTWSVGPRKRKKGRKEDGIGGVKLRKSSTTESKDVSIVAEREALKDKREIGKAANAAPHPTSAGAESASKGMPSRSSEPTPAATTAGASTGLGLGAYSSDEDD